MTKHEKFSLSFDAASAISQGARAYQEDALITEFSSGSGLGLVVLADGMGGHAAGDVASKIVVTEVFRELSTLRADMAKSSGCICDALQKAARQANETLKHHVVAHPETRGMGATLVSTVIVGRKLYWISIGDSPLFLFRDNALVQLNEDHSLSRTIDMMVQSGVLSAEDGENHPDRNMLTSALLGEPIPEIDCPSDPTLLRAGDILIVASDGLQFLTNAEIEKLLRERPFGKSSDIVGALMSSLKIQNDPDLDNVSMSVIQIELSQESVLGLQNEDQKASPETEKSSPFRKMFQLGEADARTAGPGR